MISKNFVMASTLLLLALPAMAADQSDQAGVQYYGSKSSTAATKAAPAAATASDTTPSSEFGIQTYAPSRGKRSGGKLQIPPPPRETLPGYAAPAYRQQSSAPALTGATLEKNALTLGSGSWTSKSDAVQRFSDYIELKPGMESSKLTMHLKNMGYRWFRLLIGGQVVATEKSLPSTGERDLDLTGVIQKGTNQVMLQAGGTPGARLDWKVTTPAVAKLDSLDPDEVLVGENLKLTGKNFSTNANDDQVFLGKTKARIVSVKSTALEVKVPMDSELGDVQAYVKVNGVASNKLPVKVRGIPVVSGTNLQGVPPGQQLIIFGRNFSKVAGENQVFFGDTAANVISATPTQLVVITPVPPYGAGHRPSEVKVQVGKVMSQNSVPVQIGPQMFVDPSVNPNPQDAPMFNPRDLPRSNAY